MFARNVFAKHERPRLASEFVRPATLGTGFSAYSSLAGCGRHGVALSLSDAEALLVRRGLQRGDRPHELARLRAAAVVAGSQHVALLPTAARMAGRSLEIGLQSLLHPEL